MTYGEDIVKSGGSLVESPPGLGVYTCMHGGGCGWRGVPTFVDGEPSTLCPNCERAPTQETRRKVGRNEPCPCGSGKKFKKCCGG